MLLPLALEVFWFSNSECNLCVYFGKKEAIEESKRRFILPCRVFSVITFGAMSVGR